jgi:hypothetical protein
MRGQCSFCYREVVGNINPERVLTCARCAQILLIASSENKTAFRDMLMERGDSERARSVESFISSEQEVVNEPSRKFRGTLVRKRLLAERFGLRVGTGGRCLVIGHWIRGGLV